MSRDVLVIALGETTDTNMSDMQDWLMFAGTPPIATMGQWILVVEGDVASIRSTVESAEADGLGTWFIVDSPEAIPEWTGEEAAYLAAWRLTHEQDLVQAENEGWRPDDGIYFEGLAGCNQ